MTGRLEGKVGRRVVVYRADVRDVDTLGRLDTMVASNVFRPDLAQPSLDGTAPAFAGLNPSRIAFIDPVHGAHDAGASAA